MAGTNYSYQKHMKELARKKKKEEKMRLKQEKKMRSNEIPAQVSADEIVSIDGD